MRGSETSSIFVFCFSVFLLDDFSDGAFLLCVECGDDRSILDAQRVLHVLTCADRQKNLN